MTSSRAGSSALSPEAPRRPHPGKTLSSSQSTHSLSVITVDALPVQTGLSDKTASRRTLHRHLSSGSIRTASSSGPAEAAEGAARKRSPSTATITSSYGVQNGSTSTPGSPLRKSTTALYATPSRPSNPERPSYGASIATPKRSISSSSVFSGSLGRTPKKSTLSVPQLAPIEGSIPDLRTASSSSEAVPLSHDRIDHPSVELPPPLPANAMKRVAEARLEAESSESRTARRKKSSHTLNDAESASLQLAIPEPTSSTPFAESPAPVSVTDAPPTTSSSELSKRSVSDTGTRWTTYFGRSRTLRDIASLSEEPAVMISSSTSSTPSPSLPIATTSEEASRSADLLTAKVENPDIPERSVSPVGMSSKKRKSYLNLRKFANGQATPYDSAASPEGHDSDDADSKKPAPIVVLGEDEASNAKKDETPTSQPVILSDNASGKMQQDGSWWWSWSGRGVPAVHTQAMNTDDHAGAAPLQKTEVEQVAAARVEHPSAASAAMTPAHTSSSADTVAAPVVSKTEEQSAPADAAPHTWSSWLASYVAGPPAATTTVTYGLGIADSPQPSIAGTVASSIASASAPEADESFPDPPPVTPRPSAMRVSPNLMQSRNPLFESIPASTWSGFFANRYAMPQKRVDVNAHSDAVPEEMDIDFSQAGEAGETKSRTAGPHTAVKASKPDSGRASSVKVSKSQSRASSVSGLAPSSFRSAIAFPPSPQIASHTMSPTKSSASATAQLVPPVPTNASAALSAKVKPGRGIAASQPLSPANSIAPSIPPSAAPTKPSRPNLVLPSFEDTFNTLPRSEPPPRSVKSTPVKQPAPSLKRAVTAPLRFILSGGNSKPDALPTQPGPATTSSAARMKISEKSARLPKSFTVLGESPNLCRCGRICIIGVHGWFIQSYLKSVVGEPTGTSTKFASMMKAAVKKYFSDAGHALNEEAITTIALEGDGTVNDRLAMLYNSLMRRQDWIEALNTADRIFVVAHSQGSIVSTMLLSRLINEGEINGTKCMLLSMCSISQGPFVSLNNIYTGAYLYFETGAAKELFEFQNPDSTAAKTYIECMEHVLNAGVKVLLVASLNDQVVPLYSSLFSSLSHPSLLRTIFIDSQAFETSADFMTNLVVFTTRLRNAGISPHGLDFHLSEALAGSLMGVGHSTVYDEPQVYYYAARYLLETTGVVQAASSPSHASQDVPPLFEVEPFDPRVPTNPYFLPWALRGVLEDPQIRSLFEDDISKLRDDFENWHPKTKPLQGVKLALEPLRGIPRTRPGSKPASIHETAETGKDPKKTAARL